MSVPYPFWDRVTAAAPNLRRRSWARLVQPVVRRVAADLHFGALVLGQLELDPNGSSPSRSGTDGGGPAPERFGFYVDPVDWDTGDFPDHWTDRLRTWTTREDLTVMVPEPHDLAAADETTTSEIIREALRRFLEVA